MNIIKVYTLLIFFSILLSFNNKVIYETSIKDDFEIFMKNSNKNLDLKESNNENIFIAPFLSIVMPGIGQIYNKDYKRGYMYMSLEILSWVHRKNYIDKSEKYEKMYKEFADEHWSFEKWVRDYYLFADLNHPVFNTMINYETNTILDPWEDSHHIGFYYQDQLQITNNTDGSDWFENEFKINCDSSSDNIVQCNDFPAVQIVKDHHLYEGIGKYEFFFSGWDDTHNCEELGDDENCSFILSSGNTENAFTFNKKYYQYQLRSKANDKSDIAENALTLIFVNHAVSMFDAFISNIIKNNHHNFNYYSSPIYDSTVKLNGINISILW